VMDGVGVLQPATWEEALTVVASKLQATKPEHVEVIAGSLADAEVRSFLSIILTCCHCMALFTPVFWVGFVGACSTLDSVLIDCTLSAPQALVSLKDLMNKFNVENIHTEEKATNTASDLRANYTLNSTIAGVENADLLVLVCWMRIFLLVSAKFVWSNYCSVLWTHFTLHHSTARVFVQVGTNPRYEAALFNARIRKSFIHKNLQVAVVGTPLDLNYEYTHLGMATKCRFLFFVTMSFVDMRGW
jgi:NADH dehydrogenase/NADH:ubiquinone oxidoreductase subunit G